MLTLYTYWRSSCSYRVRIGLAYKGLAYEAVTVNLLDKEQNQSEYKTLSPMGYVPSLVVDGVRYVESTAILELVEELYPERPLLPKSPRDRARVRALVQIINAGIQPLQNLNVLEHVSSDNAQRAAWARHFVSRGLAAWEALAASFAEESGKTGPFAYGDEFTMADVFLIPQVYAARRFKIDLSKYPTILRVDEATKELAYVKAAHPDVQPDAKP